MTPSDQAAFLAACVAEGVPMPQGVSKTVDHWHRYGTVIAPEVAFALMSTHLWDLIEEWKDREPLDRYLTCSKGDQGWVIEIGELSFDDSGLKVAIEAPTRAEALLGAWQKIQDK